MATVNITGVFMGVSIKTNEYNGQKNSRLYIDLYQQNSLSNSKAVTLTTDEIELLETIQKNYSIGSIFNCVATVNAYKNVAYFKLQEILNK